MKIETIVAFSDLHAECDRAIGDEFTVAAERGEELVGLGLAREVHATKPAKPVKPDAAPRPPRRKTLTPAPAAPPPLVEPAPDA